VFSPPLPREITLGGDREERATIMTNEKSYSMASDLFLRLIKMLPSIEFSNSWNNSTGYMDNYPKVEAPAQFVTPAPNSRRGIILPQGIVFERYTPGHGPLIIVSNGFKNFSIEQDEPFVHHGFFSSNLSLLAMQIVEGLIVKKNTTTDEAIAAYLDLWLPDFSKRLSLLIRPYLKTLF